MGNEHRFSSAAEAVAFCNELIRDGAADLFRGQSHDWPVIAPSLFRGDGDTRANARALLGEFLEWAGNVPQMAPYHGSKEATTAIAQHYGIPTPFLDLTTNPEIAELFACGIPSSDDASDAVIYCFKRADLQKLSSASILRIDVMNLWRLQAQDGLFLEFGDENQLDNIRSLAIRLYFPRRNLTQAESTRLYPVRKSALEIVIDQWIYRSNIAEVFNKLSSIKRIRYTRRYTYPGVFRWRNVPQLEGEWLAYNPGWIFPSPENVTTALESLIVNISLDNAQDPKTAVSTLSEQLRPSVESYAHTGAMVEFRIHIAGHAWESESASLLLNRCWDGIRAHPYQTKSVVTCMATTAMTLIRQVLHPEAGDWEEALWGDVEAIDTAPIGGHLESAGVEKSRFLEARHSTYDGALTTYARRRAAADRLYLMDYVVDPWTLFDFERLARIFVEQFIPSCIGSNWGETLSGDDRTLSDLWGLSYNPALLAFVTRFGFRFTSPISSEGDVEHLILVAPDMDEADLEEVCLSALPSVLKGGDPFVIRFTEYNQDPRELWQIERVIEQCEMIVRVGGISVLDVIPGLREAGPADPDADPGALGAIHIWAIAKGRLNEVSGVDLREAKHTIDEFLRDLSECNSILEARGKSQPDWPLHDT